MSDIETVLPPLWLPTLQSHISSTDPTTKYAQLATLTAEGRPSVRTVVIRQVSATDLKICTDMRSHKIEGLRRCEWAELCWYFTQPRIQFRITGTVHIADMEEDGRRYLWDKLSSNAKTSFFAPAPGTAKEDTTEKLEERFDFNEIPDSFALLLFTPTKVDLVNLRKSERRIWEYRDNSEKWSETDVYP